jgi:hypothetical protein
MAALAEEYPKRTLPKKLTLPALADFHPAVGTARTTATGDSA